LVAMPCRTCLVRVSVFHHLRQGTRIMEGIPNWAELAEECEELLRRHVVAVRRVSVLRQSRLGKWATVMRPRRQNRTSSSSRTELCIGLLASYKKRNSLAGEALETPWSWSRGLGTGGRSGGVEGPKTVEITGQKCLTGSLRGPISRLDCSSLDRCLGDALRIFVDNSFRWTSRSRDDDVDGHLVDVRQAK
jgi:hypothetical protein